MRGVGLAQLDAAWLWRTGEGPPDAGPAGDVFRLVTRIGEATWLGRNPDGAYVTVRRFPGAPDPAEFDAVTQRVAAFGSVPTGTLVPALGAQRSRDALWLVSALDDGVWLDRLLALAELLPAQAVVLGLDITEAVRTVHEAGHAHGAISASQFRVGVDGRGRLDGWLTGALTQAAPAVTAPEEHRRADLAAVTSLLSTLADAVRAHPGPHGTARAEATSLVAALDEAAARARAPDEHDGADLPAPLTAVCDPEREAATRTEIGALVRAAAGTTPPPGPPPARPGPAQPGATQPRPAQPRPARPRPAPATLPAGISADPVRSGLRTAWRRMWTTLAALAVVAAVVGLEFVLLHDRLVQDLHLLTGGAAGGAPAAQRSTSSPPTPLSKVPIPAPPSAGAVERVDLRGLDSCTPGSECALRVLVQLAPTPGASPATEQAPPQAVTWTFQVFDRCSSGTHTLAGGSLPVDPGDTAVQAVTAVRLPPGRAFAVVAVTGAPGAAASTPLPVPTHPASC